MKKCALFLLFAVFLAAVLWSCGPESIPVKEPTEKPEPEPEPEPESEVKDYVERP